MIITSVSITLYFLNERLRDFSEDENKKTNHRSRSANNVATNKVGAW